MLQKIVIYTTFHNKFYQFKIFLSTAQLLGQRLIHSCYSTNNTNNYWQYSPTLVIVPAHVVAQCPHLHTWWHSAHTCTRGGTVPTPAHVVAQCPHLHTGWHSARTCTRGGTVPAPAHVVAQCPHLKTWWHSAPTCTCGGTVPPVPTPAYRVARCPQCPHLHTRRQCPQCPHLHMWWNSALSAHTWTRSSWVIQLGLPLLLCCATSSAVKTKAFRNGNIYIFLLCLLSNFIVEWDINRCQFYTLSRAMILISWPSSLNYRNVLDTHHLLNLCTSWVSFAYQLCASRHPDGGVVVRDQPLNFSRFWRY